MSVNYYTILQVDRKANADDLKRAYRKLAMKWHPDKNPNNQRTADAKMKTISQAYNVLIDPQTRLAYDQQQIDGFCSNSRAMGRTRRDPRPAVYGVSSGFYSDGMGMYGSLGRAASANSATYSYMRTGAAVERSLRCSLEDLYMGTPMKTKIAWDVLDDFGRRTTTEEFLTIDIKPGWRKGTKITFEGLGNQQSMALQLAPLGLGNEQSRAMPPSVLVLTIDEMHHRVFKRDGNDLIATLNISLVEALTGYTANLTTLDRRNLTIPIDSIIGPTYEVVVRGEGMPILNEPSRYGDLRIKFNIKFPDQLTSEQKMSILPLLTSS